MITPDIKPEWLPVVSHIKDQCETNNGFASVKVSIPVFNEVPVPVDTTANGVPGPGWLSIIRHLQAKCGQNLGLAIAQMKVVVVGDSPVLWEEAILLPLRVDVGINRIRPMGVKGLGKAPDLIAAVSCFLPGALD